MCETIITTTVFHFKVLQPDKQRKKVPSNSNNSTERKLKWTENSYIIQHIL
ncbi:hypothetical protein DOY81_005351 [Sarcophaga bullata]|nr:hypothetical protein DOY81_005351 [Sarcophaga bullata]